MKHTKNWIGMLVMMLVFGMMVVGCKTDSSEAIKMTGKVFIIIYSVFFLALAIISLFTGGLTYIINMVATLVLLFIFLSMFGVPTWGVILIIIACLGLIGVCTFFGGVAGAASASVPIIGAMIYFSTRVLA